MQSVVESKHFSKYCNFKYRTNLNPTDSTIFTIKCLYTGTATTIMGWVLKRFTNFSILHSKTFNSSLN